MPCAPTVTTVPLVFFGAHDDEGRKGQKTINHDVLFIALFLAGGSAKLVRLVLVSPLTLAFLRSMRDAGT
jgi:hypothetical protein